MVHEEQGGWVAIGARQVCEAEMPSREDTAWAPVGGLRLLHTLLQGDALIVTRADMHVKMIAEARQQQNDAHGVRGIHRVLWMVSQYRASMTALFLTPHSILVHCMMQCKTLVMEGPLHRGMYGAAAR